MKNDNVESKKERQIHFIAFSELVSYINETRSCDETISVYKFSDLSKLFMERIICLGAEVSFRVNSSRLKDRIVSNFPDLDAYTQGTQLLMYSCTKKLSNRHMKDHEPPDCAYLGIMIHCKTRKRDLVDTFCKLGLSVSYNRVLEISTSMANEVLFALPIYYKMYLLHLM
ncbi:unnamed protein product [Mytilus edulis]|uniref:Uncharacterized protein n=1 Tax=Mytilus edulis TaxID=6550 RepID=A0A8S3R5Q0_MYTED|nr:unnamed protein product [Mytilus edulis]